MARSSGGPAGVVQQAGEVAVERIEPIRWRQRARRTGAPCGRRPSRSGSRRAPRSVSPRGIEDRPQHDVGDRPAQALGADHRRPRAARSISLVVVVALERAGRAAHDLGGEDDVAARSGWRRRPTSSPRRAASSSAAGSTCGARGSRPARSVSGGDHLVEPLHQRARSTDGPAAPRTCAATGGHADDPAEELDPLRIGEWQRRAARGRRGVAPFVGAPRRAGAAAIGRCVIGMVPSRQRRGAFGRRRRCRARDGSCVRTDSTSGPTPSGQSARIWRQAEYRQRRCASANVPRVGRSADRVQDREPERRGDDEGQRRDDDRRARLARQRLVALRRR